MKLLVPSDGSRNAFEALKEATLLAKAGAAKIIMLNVQPTFHTAHTNIFFDEKQIREYQEQLSSEELADAVKFLAESGVSYEVRLRAGVPKDQILLEAGESGARWIVMGSRGVNPIIGGVLGTTSYGVLQAANCPVMIVPYRE